MPRSSTRGPTTPSKSLQSDRSKITMASLNLYSKEQTDSLLSAKANTADLATVATSGSYNDLSSKPTIPSITDNTTYYTITY